MVCDTLEKRVFLISSFFRVRFFLCEFIELNSAIEFTQGNSIVQCVYTHSCLRCLHRKFTWIHTAIMVNLEAWVEVHIQNMIILQLYRGGTPEAGIWVTRIAVTLSIFYFRRWFLVQIVENRRGYLSRPFLIPGDNFSKSYDENRFVWQLYGGG